MLETLEARTLLSTATVTDNADSGPGSLRDAIANAASGDMIVFADSLKNQTITLTSGQLAVYKSLDIEGPGATGLTLSGNGASRVFYLYGGRKVTIAGLTITDGMAPSGGGILETTTGGSLTVNNCAFTNNQAVDDGSFNNGLGGAIESARGALNVSNSAFSNNTGDSFSGGAIDLGFSNTAPATISDSTFTGNQVTSPGNAFGGAIGESYPQTMRSTLSITRCSFTDNTASTTGGSQAVGGAIGVFNTATISDSTFSGNVASGGDAGGFIAGGGAVATGYWTNSAGHSPAFTLTVTGCTITGNSALGAPGADGVKTFGRAVGGGIYDSGGTAGAKVTLIVRDSTVSGNKAVGGALDPNANPPQKLSTAFSLSSEGGGIYSSGPLTVTDSTISGNQVIGGAGSANYPGLVGAGGGIILSNYVSANGVVGNTATGTVSGCTIDDNTATGGAGGPGTAGGDGVGGGIDVAFGAPLTVTNTTVAHNQATGGGGPGVDGVGGGIDVGTAVILGKSTDSSTLKLTNCTISGNVAGAAPGGPTMAARQRPSPCCPAARPSTPGAMHWPSGLTASLSPPISAAITACSMQRWTSGRSSRVRPPCCPATPMRMGKSTSPTS